MNPIVHLHQHPVLADTLAVLRSTQSDSAQFRTQMDRAANVLLFEATRQLPTRTASVTTPLEETTASVLSSEAPTIIVPILRAGLTWLSVAQAWLPQAPVHMLGMARDPQSLAIETYFNTLARPQGEHLDVSKASALILDPMLATGHSLLAAIEVLLAKGFKEENLIFVGLLASPEGVETLHHHYPALKMVLGCIDRQLNEKSYILPGLGDAGDRAFNTPHA